MATTNIELDIENITGVADANDQFIVSAQKSIVVSIPKELMWQYASTYTSVGSSGQALNGDTVLDVSLVTGQVAERVSASRAYDITDSSSLYKATTRYPKYYIKDGKVYIAPTPSDDGIVSYINYSNIDDDSDLRSAVVFHASSKEFEKLATSKVSDWSDLVQPSSPTLTSTTVSFSTSVPTYLSPALEDRSAFSAYTSGLSETDPGIFSITAVPPSNPSSPSFTTPAIGAITVASTTLSNIGVPPVYTSPVVGGDAAELSSLDDLDVDNVIDTLADQPEWDQWFATAAHFIEDEEDSELAAAQLQKISAYIQAYSGAMQNQLNIFNDANAEYQGKLQEATQQAQINAQKAQAQAQIDATDAQQETSLLLQKENQEYAASLQKFSAEVQEYQANVSKEVQEYSQKLSQYQTELQTSVQTWQQEENEKVARYQAEVQNNINKFNKENTEYQAQLQISIQNAQLESSDDTQKLQKFASDLQSYASKVNEQSQKFTLSSQNAVYYANESKKYYEWAITEINMYIQNNSKMINRTMAAQAAQQQRS
ncbi:hypothetical protein HN682_03760 [Candidatus Peregrinibacteria bacterium]|nr:hypothetical protein [Candidatus Peregrinibacteria bacterium]